MMDMDSVRRLVRLQFPARRWRRAVQGLSALGGTGTTTDRPHLLILVVLVLGPHRGKHQHVPSERSERPPAAEAAEAAERPPERRCRGRRGPQLSCVDRGGGSCERPEVIFGLRSPGRSATSYLGGLGGPSEEP